MSERVLYWKEDLPATCPHCGKVDDYVFYLNTTSLVCGFCGEEFDIELLVSDIKVRSL